MSNISRNKMPQVDTQNLSTAIDMVSEKVKVTKGTIAAGRLKKSQKELHQDKVVGIANRFTSPNKFKPLIISKDNYVVDGHHRWGAAIYKWGQEVKIPIIRINLPILEAIKLYKEVAERLNQPVKETIKKVGDKYAVYPKKGGDRLGTHDTKSAAQKQLAAIEISKHKNEGLFTTDNALKPYEKLLVAAIVEFMRSKYNISSKIIVRKKQSNNMFGDIVLNDNTLNKDKFYLHFNPNASYAFIIQSIIHELIHVKQISRGELRPSRDYKELLWKGKSAILVSDYKKFQRSDYNEYKKLPWEAEAYGGMKPLYRKFLKSKQFQALTGQDANLDYIISSLTEIRMVGEDITIPINIGDTVLGGKFKNKRIVVKSIDKNEKGDITINGKPLMKFRLVNENMGVSTQCPNCNHSWDLEYNDDRKFLCHNCGYDSQMQKIDLVGLKDWKNSLKENVAPNHNGKSAPYGSGYDEMDESTDNLEMLQLMNKVFKAFPQSPKQKELIKKLNILRIKNGMKPIGEGKLNEIPMGDLQKIDQFADKQLNPIDVVLTDKHFFDRLNDPRNGKEISNAELIGFFKRLSKKKKEFVEFLNQYNSVVATDAKTNINIPFMKRANRAIAKTVMRKKDFKTPDKKLDI